MIGNPKKRERTSSRENSVQVGIEKPKDKKKFLAKRDIIENQNQLSRGYSFQKEEKAKTKKEKMLSIWLTLPFKSQLLSP